MEERFSLLDDLVPKQTAPTKFRTVYMILAFSLSPLSIHLSSALKHSGLIPFLISVILINLFLYCMYSVIVSACYISRAATYTELLNNYFHRMDRPISFVLLLYCLLLISIYQISISLLASSIYMELVKDVFIKFKIFMILSTIVSVNVVIVYVSRHKNCDKFKELYLETVIIWVLFLIAMIIIAAVYNGKDTEQESNENNGLFNWDFYSSTYLLIVVLNFSQSFTLVFTDIREANNVINKDEVMKSIKISAAISIGFYVMLTILLFEIQQIQGFGQWIIIIEKFFSTVILALQIALTIFTARNALIQAVFSHSFELGKTSALIISVFIATVTALINIFLYDGLYNLNEENSIEYTMFPVLNNLYFITAFFSICVGIGIPWMLMIKTENYNGGSIFATLIVGGLITAAVIATVYDDSLSKLNLEYLI